MKKKFSVVLVVVVAIMMVVTACAPQQAAQSPEPTAQTQESPTKAPETQTPETQTPEAQTPEAGQKVGLLWNTQQIQACVESLASAKAKVESLGYEAIVVDANLDINAQLSGMENLIQQQVAGVICIPVDSQGIISAIDKAEAANIPVVTIDVNADGGKVFNYIGNDNYLCGQITGQYIADKLEGEGNIVVLNVNINSAGRDRYQGLMDVLANYPDIKVVGDQEAYTIEAGVNVMSNYLQGAEPVHAVWAVNDPAAIGAARAIESAGKEGEMFIASTDGDPEVVNMIKGGETIIELSVAQDIFSIGSMGAEAIDQAIKGGEPIVNSTVETDIPTFYTSVYPITAETVNEYGGWTEAVPEDAASSWQEQ